MKCASEDLDPDRRPRHDFLAETRIRRGAVSELDAPYTIVLMFAHTASEEHSGHGSHVEKQDDSREITAVEGAGGLSQDVHLSVQGRISPGDGSIMPLREYAVHRATSCFGRGLDRFKRRPDPLHFSRGVGISSARICATTWIEGRPERASAFESVPTDRARTSGFADDRALGKTQCHDDELAHGRGLHAAVRVCRQQWRLQL